MAAVNITVNVAVAEILERLAALGGEIKKRDDRIDELLRANSEEVTRRRAAESHEGCKTMLDVAEQKRLALERRLNRLKDSLGRLSAEYEPAPNPSN